MEARITEVTVKYSKGPKSAPCISFGDFCAKALGSDLERNTDPAHTPVNNRAKVKFSYDPEDRMCYLTPTTGEGGNVISLYHTEGFPWRVQVAGNPTEAPDSGATELKAKVAEDGTVSFKLPLDLPRAKPSNRATNGRKREKDTPEGFARAAETALQDLVIALGKINGSLKAVGQDGNVQKLRLSTLKISYVKRVAVTTYEDVEVEL